MKILFLSSWYPFPPDNGSKLRIYNLLRGLRQQHDVTLIALTNEDGWRSSPDVQALCTRVHVVPGRPYNPSSKSALLGLASTTPRALVDTYTPRMEERIRQETSEHHYDLVVASQRVAASYWRAYSGLPSIFEELELGVFEAKRDQAPTFFQRLRHRLPLLKLRFYLQGLLPHFTACTVVSSEERLLLRRYVPNYKPVHVVPNCVDLASYRDVRETPQPERIIFTGSFRYFANYDAMRWFVSEVFPRVQARAPHVRLTITGDHGDLPLPPAANVTRTGFVDDVRPLISASWLSVAPLRLGGGTRLKILESMALRTPVVATSKGAEGLEARHDEHLLIADTPDAFADAITRLLVEPGLRQRLVDNAYQLVQEQYDWASMMLRFLELVEEVTRTTTNRSQLGTPSPC